MSGLSTPLLVLVFVVGAGATWLAGISLSKTTDSLDRRFGLGEELGGLILLAVAGTLPELAITASAARSGHLSLAVGNLIGGIAVQTLVLVVLDACTGEKRPLTFLVGSLIPVLEGLLVIAVLITVMSGASLLASINVGGASPTSIAAVAFWFAGIWLINRARKEPKWKVEMAGSEPGRRNVREDHPDERRPFVNRSTVFVALIFGLASLITLAAGVVLQESGNELADRMGLQGAIFGATILAAATALPEISSGVAAVQLGDHQLAVGDILGGNSFQITLFLLADLIAGTPVVIAVQRSDAWLGAAGILMTAVVATAVILRPGRKYFRVGPDSIALVAIYAAVIALLPRVT